MPQAPPRTWPHFDLYERIQSALRALPTRFEPELHVAGILATDIFALNSSLGATIETAVVDGLNAVRSVWDPDGAYAEYAFVRQGQRFPDVLLAKAEGDGERRPIIGLELKGWYLLAKEAEPSFRFMASANACAPQDLLVVYPWALGQVISGRPVLFTPYIRPSRYAAEWRNHYWQQRRGPGSDPRIRLAENIEPYPTKSDAINDEAVSDKGKNFGRVARTGMMDEYKLRIERELLAGIPAVYWREFFKAFKDGADAPAVDRRLRRLATQLTPAEAGSRIVELGERLMELVDLLEGDRESPGR